MAVFGIRIGATSASLAVYQDDKVEIVANDVGDRTTPAVVAFTNGEKSVGLAARQNMFRNSSNTICHVMSILGLTNNDTEVEQYRNSHSYKVIYEKDELHFEVFNGEGVRHVYSCSDVLNYIFLKLRDFANHRCGEADTHNAVIAFPAHYTEKQRETMIKAAQKSGVNVLQAISEPSASLLAYHIGQKNPNEDCYCMVYRMGGTSLDITIVHVFSGMYEVLAHDHFSDKGGDGFTQVLVNHFAEEFHRQFKLDVKESRRSVSKLVSASENCKHILSSMSTAHCFVESLHEGVDFSCNITRARYESLIGLIIAQCLSPLDSVLQKAQLKSSDISKIILAGGATKMPKLQLSLAECFPSTSELLLSIAPDEVIAIGAANQAAIARKSHAPADSRVLVLSKGIYVKTIDNGTSCHHCVVPPSTLIPLNKQHVFRLDKTTSCRFEIFQADSSQSSTLCNVNVLGKVVMHGLPADSAEILISVHMKRDGHLHVTCTEKHTSQTEGIVVEPAKFLGD